MSLLARLGLTRPELRAWAMYDWANSAFWTTVIVAVFPPFFSDYAAAGLTPNEATARFAWTTTIAVTIVAVLGPVLGAIADYRAVKKRMLAAFMALGVAATLLMATIERGGWAYAALLFPSPRARCFMTPCCRTSRRPTSSTVCRRQASRSGSSAAAFSCW
jgi:UMF1 family MFS transporter